MSGSRWLVVTDGDVRGLLACAAAAVEHGEGQRVWPCIMTEPEELAGIRDEAAAEQAEVYEHGVIRHDPAVPVEAGPGEREARLLLEAAWLAVRKQADGVIWAVPPADGTLAGLAALQSRAVLVERLVGLGAADEIGIRVPYADLTDRQVADLILDMDLPIWLCWWWGVGRGPRGAPGFAQARAEYERWDALLKEAGWTDGVPGPATVE